ncbi:MAG: hypothetical protein ACRC1H_18055, partial [Caldilineaceae bacterium]
MSAVSAMTSARRTSTLTPDALSALLAPGAHARLARLPHTTPPRHVAETLAALANANGGWLLVDADSTSPKTRSKAAAAFDPATAADLILHASLLCDPPLILPAPQAVDAQSHGSSPALLVEVPAGLPGVYNVGGIYPTRTGAHNRPLTTTELRHLLRDRAEGAYEAQVVEGASLDDLDPVRVDRYLDRLMLPPAEEATATLAARGCLVRDHAEWRPTVAGILLFGRAPQNFQRSAEILCVRYPGTQMADEFVRQEIGGPLPDQ